MFIKSFNSFSFKSFMLCFLITSNLEAEEINKINDIYVYGNKSGLAVRGRLKDDLISTEVFNSEQLEKSGQNNFIDALNKNAGISEQLDCSICGARGVSLNQLPSGYTTIMIDGIPIYSAVSSVYGLDGINLNGIESIEVARGAGAAVTAPESLSGTVNIITKRPKENQTVLSFKAGSYETEELQGYIANSFDKGAVSINAANYKRGFVDSDNNGIVEAVSYDRKNFGVSYFLDDFYKFKIKGRIDIFDEIRNGGAANNDSGIVKSNLSGNPFAWDNTRNGAGYALASGYNNGLGGMSEIIETNRKQITNIAVKDTDFGQMKLAFGAAHHEQNSYYEQDIYDAVQNQYYSEASSRIDFEKINSSLTLGLNYIYQDLDSLGRVYDFNSNSYGGIVDGIDNYRYTTIGVFTSFYNAAFNQKLESNLALRIDKHSEFGGIVTPRVNFLFHHNDNIASRLSLGTGYHAPASYFEYEHGLLSVSNIRRQINDPEKSENVSYALSYESDRFNSTLSLNYSNIKNIALVEIEGNSGLFRNSDNDVQISNIDLNASYYLTPKLLFSFGGQLSKFNFTTGDLPIARPEETAFISIDYDINNKISLFSKVNWTGKQDLAKFYGDRYNLDGSKKSDNSPNFFTVDLRSEYKINNHNSISFGVNNLFDYVQANKDSQLFLDSSNPATAELGTSNIWGPNIGRVLYLNYKINF